MNFKYTLLVSLVLFSISVQSQNQKKLKGYLEKNFDPNYLQKTEKKSDNYQRKLEQVVASVLTYKGKSENFVPIKGSKQEQYLNSNVSIKENKL